MFSTPHCLLKYIRGVKAKSGGSVASLLQEYQQNTVSHRSDTPSSQKYFYESKSSIASAKHHAVQLRLGSAQVLTTSRERVANTNENHPLFFSRTAPRESGLCGQLVTSLWKLKINRLTELQGALVPLILKGKHIIAHAETGTGKSFGIALALSNRIIRDNINYKLHTLIFVPTEELALQYDKWFRYLGGCTSQVVQAAIPSIPLESQLAKLHNIQPHVLVGTPQRIADIARVAPTILGEKLRKKVDCVILDEADMILSSNVTYGKQMLTGTDLIDRVFRSQPEEVPAQMVAASATIDTSTAQKLNNWMRNDKAVRLTTSFVEHTIPLTINFYFFSASKKIPLDEGLTWIMRLICKQNALPRVLIFCKDEEVERLTRYLNEKVASTPEANVHLRSRSGRAFAGALNHIPDPEITQPSNPHNFFAQELRVAPSKGDVYVKNNSSISNLNEGKLIVGVGRFEVGRGLHVNGITHVIIYGDCPNSSTFVHCSGRTGRMGREGDVIVLFPPSSGRLVKQVCHSVEIPFERGDLERVKNTVETSDFSSSGSLESVKKNNISIQTEIQAKQMEYLKGGNRF